VSSKRQTKTLLAESLLRLQLHLLRCIPPLFTAAPIIFDTADLQGSPFRLWGIALVPCAPEIAELGEHGREYARKRSSSNTVIQIDIMDVIWRQRTDRDILSGLS
jgi:hypothetical protein